MMQQSQSTRPRLTRDTEHQMLGGVCAGIARQYGFDVTIVRVVTVLLTLAWGAGLIAYIALWVLMPAGEPSDAGVASSTSAPLASAAAASTAAASDDLAERAKRAAEDLAIAARSAADAARVAADQLGDVARAATAAGRESWQQQRAERHAPRASSTATEEDRPATVASAPPAPPETPPPPFEVTPPPGPDDIRPE